MFQYWELKNKKKEKIERKYRWTDRQKESNKSFCDAAATHKIVLSYVVWETLKRNTHRLDGSSQVELPVIL